jgi:uncharacterized protein YdeI (YjbR/CyaY-like superfamily)
MTKPDLEILLEETNPGLTKQEIDELSEAIWLAYGDDLDDIDSVGVPRDQLQDALNAVNKLKTTFERVEPQSTEDIILVNEMGVLSYRLSELLIK